jgi:response regulator RpfG family c-di-GMP phosphodiesterase
MTDKARILFVDDEKRVLNAMRGLFRRHYELFLTCEGAEAVQIAVENDVDVIVADQRMPGMTGIEVLAEVKRRSPRTVRILLTGYADPTAVEGSINLGEVFRFLSKPCPPRLLRETLSLAITAASPRLRPGPRPRRNPPPRPLRHLYVNPRHRLRSRSKPARHRSRRRHRRERRKRLRP